MCFGACYTTDLAPKYIFVPGTKIYFGAGILLVILRPGLHLTTLIQEGLLKAGYSSREAAKKPCVTPKMRRKRIDWCMERLEWSEDQWMDVMWSDESNFELIRGTCKSVRRPYGSDRYHPTFTVKTIKHPSPGSPFVPIFRILSQIWDF